MVQCACSAYSVYTYSMHTQCELLYYGYYNYAEPHTTKPLDLLLYQLQAIELK